MNPTANDLWAIWNGGKVSALVALLRGGTSIKEREEILYSAWSEAMGQMMAIMPGDGCWENLTKEERIKALKEKTFSLKNFQNSIFDPPFKLFFEQNLPY